MEDNIPTELALNEKYDFSFKIKASERPDEVGFYTGQGGGSIDFDYSNNTVIINHSWKYDRYLLNDTMYQPNEKVRIRLVLTYKYTDSADTTEYEKYYLDSKELTLVDTSEK